MANSGIIDLLNTTDDHDVARTALSKLTVSGLKQVCDDLGICIAYRNKADLVDKIVVNTVGARLKFAALLAVDLG